MLENPLPTHVSKTVWLSVSGLILYVIPKNERISLKSCMLLTLLIYEY